MRLLPCYLLGLACLATPGTMSAHDHQLTRTIPHNHLLFSKLSATVEMLDKGKEGDSSNPAIKVIVTWEVKKPDDGTAGNKNVYFATISFFDPSTLKPVVASKTYSLVSLGFQAVDWENEIIGVPTYGSADLILEYGAVQEPIELRPPLREPVRIPRTGKRWHKEWGKDVLISDNVCMLRLSGASEYKFTVRDVNALKPGVTRWDNDSVSEGHDNQPPKNPPD